MFVLKMSCAAELSSINYFDELCERALELMNIRERRMICLAIHEALINSLEAMQKKYSHRTSEDISLTLKLNDRDIEIEVTDYAGGISQEILDAFTSLKKPDIFAERGRGLLFIHHFMDDVSFETTDEKKFVFRMKKGVMLE